MNTGETLVERNLREWLEMNGQQATDMPCVGDSPYGDAWPPGVWCWDEITDQVLIGTCPDDARILTYVEATEVEHHPSGWYALAEGYTLANVPRWVHDSSFDHEAFMPDPDLDWVSGPYATEQEARAAVASLVEENER